MNGVGEGDEAAEETRGALLEGAKAMLTEYLRKTRQSRRKGGGSRGIDSRKLDMVSSNWQMSQEKLTDVLRSLIPLLPSFFPKLE